MQRAIHPIPTHKTPTLRGTHPKFSALVRWPLALPMWKRDRSAWGPRCVIAEERNRAVTASYLDSTRFHCLCHMALPPDGEFNGFATWHPHARDSHGWDIEIARQSVIALCFAHPKYKVIYSRCCYNLFCKISRWKHLKIDVLMMKAYSCYTENVNVRDLYFCIDFFGRLLEDFAKKFQASLSWELYLHIWIIHEHKMSCNSFQAETRNNYVEDGIKGGTRNEILFGINFKFLYLKNYYLRNSESD